MLVQQSQAGSIIGRAGFKIKNLREVCTVKICVLWLDLRADCMRRVDQVNQVDPVDRASPLRIYISFVFLTF